MLKQALNFKVNVTIIIHTIKIIDHIELDLIKK